MDFRTIIGIALMMLVYFVFLMPSPPPPSELEPAGEAQEQAAASPAREAASEAVDTPTRPTKTTQANRFEDRASQERLILESDRIRVTMNALGEVLRVELPLYTTQPDSEEIIHFAFTPEHPFNRLELISENQPIRWERFEAAEKSLILFGRSSSGLRVTRIITLAPDNTYSLKFVDEISNEGRQSEALRLGVVLNKRSREEQNDKGFFMSLFSGPPDVDQVNWFEDDNLEVEPMLALVDSPREIPADLAWTGYSDKYFFQGFVPHNFDIERLILSHEPAGSLSRQKLIQQQIRNSMIQVAPGGTKSFEYSFYLGPKKIPELRKIEESLSRSVDYGNWIGPITRFLLLILLFFHSLIPNYGIAIILLTLVVKAVLFPLAWKAAFSMRKLALVQPKMKEIQTKYKKDPQRLQAEMMALYKSEKVNPLGGCLPIILQMPVFFALYKLFYASFEMRHAPFFGWIQDLSAYDPFFITPVLMVLLMWAQQKITPMPGMGGEETEAIKLQKRIFKWMPFIFGAVMIFLPSGLTLYFLVNAGLSVAQQYFMNKRLDNLLPRDSNEVLKAANGS